MSIVRAVILILAVLVATGFGVRSYHAWQLLTSAERAGATDTSTIRPWMTIRYVARTYDVPETELAARLDLPEASDPDLSLRALAMRRGDSPVEYVQKVQRAVGEIRRSGVDPPPGAGR